MTDIQINPPPCKIQHELKGQRQSNIEFLRILAMLMILTLHTRFEGIESVYDGGIDANHICRFSFQAMSIIGVNLFVLISGYFGIKLKNKGIINLVWQVVYIAVICLGIRILWSHYNGEVFVFDKKWLFPVTNTVWFIPSYIMLMLFSPIINVFIDGTSTRKLVHYTIGLYLLSYYWSSIWVGTVMGFDGYSWGWFIILYLTGRIIRRMNEGNKLASKSKALFGYIGFTIAIVAVAFLQNFIPVGRSLLWVYNSPLVYASSICLFMFFCQLHISSSKVINFFAASAFAVLLLHMSLFAQYQNICKSIYCKYDGVVCIGITLCFILCVYLFSTIIDQPRKILYSLFFKKK